MLQNERRGTLGKGVLRFADTRSIAEGYNSNIAQERIFTMNTVDFSPLYRSTIGFDHLASLLDSLGGERNQPAYPPYNIALIEEDKYRITMAVAGFTDDEIDVQVENNMLTVSARREDKENDTRYLYRGIAERNFQRQFRLENHVKVVSAALENGLLHINLEREIPEAMKPRTIPIARSTGLAKQSESREQLTDSSSAAA